MNISKATAIQGWMTEPELKFLAEQASIHKIIVEVGSFLGRSTRALADNTSGTVYAIDDFIGPRDVEIPKEERTKIYDLFLKNMEGLANVVPVVSGHDSITLEVSPDMVFIDGDHKYASVKRDIKFWKSKLSIGGLLSGHDAFFPEVYQAITEEGLDFRVALGTAIWYCTPR